MKKRIQLFKSKLPEYVKSEELFGMVVHIVGAALSIALLVLCIIRGAAKGSVAAVLTGIVFGVCMVLLYVISAIYHGLSPRVKGKAVMRVLDHCSVFLLIAGTYTPVTVCALAKADPALAWVIFGVVWGMSVIGIVLNVIDVDKYFPFSMACYIALGWCIILSLPQLMTVLPMMAISLLFCGGVAYTAGAVLFGLGSKRRYAHTVFHIMVVIGSVFHGLMVLLFVL